MSGGRSHRRRIGRSKVIYRPVAVEPSHETGEWTRRINEAHDDDNVSYDEFMELCHEWHAYAGTLSEAERVEACMLLTDHAQSSLAGVSVKTVAYIRPHHGRPAAIVARWGA
jgi:hypothetical protein